MGFTVDSKYQSKLKPLFSHYDGITCVQKILLKFLEAISFAIVEFGSPLSNARGIISTELSPVRELESFFPVKLR